MLLIIIYGIPTTCSQIISSRCQLLGSVVPVSLVSFKTWLNVYVNEYNVIIIYYLINITLFDLLTIKNSYLQDR